MYRSHDSASSRTVSHQIPITLRQKAHPSSVVTAMTATAIATTRRLSVSVGRKTPKIGKLYHFYLSIQSQTGCAILIRLAPRRVPFSSLFSLLGKSPTSDDQADRWEASTTQ